MLKNILYAYILHEYKTLRISSAFTVKELIWKHKLPPIMLELGLNSSTIIRFVCPSHPVLPWMKFLFLSQVSRWKDRMWLPADMPSQCPWTKKGLWTFLRCFTVYYIQAKKFLVTSVNYHLEVIAKFAAVIPYITTKVKRILQDL